MKNRTLLIFAFAALLVIAPACGNNDDAPLTNTETLPAQESPVTVLESSGSGPCDNILLPLMDGNNWVYDVNTIDEGGNPETIEVLWSVFESQGNNVTLNTSFGDSETELSADVTCTDGAIENFPMAVSDIAIGDMEGAFEYTHVSGNYLPSEAELDAGNWENSWQTVVNASGTLSAGSGSEEMTVVLESSPITLNWQILENNASVTVPAGTFENAVRINQKMVFEINSMTINTGDMPLDISTTMTFDTDYWFVPNIGLVKTDVQSVNIELFGSQFPTDMAGDFALKSSNLVN